LVGLVVWTIGLRALDLAFQVCKKIGPRLCELVGMREVIDGVSDLVAVISLNFANSPKCIPIAFPKVDVRPIHRHLLARFK
jgi:hypothetical protein